MYSAGIEYLWPALNRSGALSLYPRVSHEDGGNVVYLDGHAEWVKSDEVTYRLAVETNWAWITW